MSDDRPPVTRTIPKDPPANFTTRPAKPPVVSVDVDTPTPNARAASKAAGTFGKLERFFTRDRRD